MKEVATQITSHQQLETSDQEWNAINTTIWYFERKSSKDHDEKPRSITFFSVWCDHARVVRKVPAGLETYLNRPLAVLIADKKNYDYHEIK